MLKIGNICLKNEFILAPMAGYTSPPFRRLMAQNMAALTVSEMVSVNGINYLNKKTGRLLETCPEEAVKCVQLFGSRADDFAKAIESKSLDGFDIIDINMGCPVRKVVSVGSGSALIDNPVEAAKIVSTLKALGKTVSVKTRLGIDNPLSVLDFALRLQWAGADLIALHCRTARQMYSGLPDFSVAAKLKKLLRIPLVVNGDIVDKNSLDLARQTGADGFMIGRGALINPLIFREFCNQSCTVIEHKQAVLQLIDYMTAHFGATQAASQMRKFLPFMLKTVKRSVRHELNCITDSALLKQEVRRIFDNTI